jgi:hypothetical protein
MRKSDLAKWMILISIIIFAGCTKTRFPNLFVAEQQMVQDCQYLDTISEVSDPGKFVTNYQFVKYYDGELKVLERADNMKATHIVWMYNYPAGSSASAYRCIE